MAIHRPPVRHTGATPTPPPERSPLSPSVRALTRVLVVSILALHAMSALATIVGGSDLYGLPELVDVRQEANLPTLWSTLALLACAAVLWLLGRVEPVAWPWRLLAGVFAYLAVDEAISLHELVSSPLRNAADLGGVLHYAWVLPAGVAVLGLAVALGPFLLGLPPSTRARFTVAAALYLAGALALELPESLLVSGSGDDDGVAVAVLGAVEEALEMTGIAVFLVALARHLRDRAPDWSVRLEA